MVKNTNWLYLLIISSLGLYALYLALYRSLHDGAETAHKICQSYQAYVENYVSKKCTYQYGKPPIPKRPNSK